MSPQRVGWSYWSFHLSFLNVYLDYNFCIAHTARWLETFLIFIWSLFFCLFVYFCFFLSLWSYGTYYVLNFSTFWSSATRRKMNDTAIRQSFLAISSAHPWPPSRSYNPKDNSDVYPGLQREKNTAQTQRTYKDKEEIKYNIYSMNRPRGNCISWM